MRTKLRRILAIFMAVVTITATVAGCGGDSDKGTDTTTAGNLLTRGQWIEMLGKGFGMDEYTGTEAYYKDVNEKDEIYAYVQSCYEWDILSTGTDEFKPNDIATLGFVITTSVLAAELDYDEYIEDDDVNAAIIKCAKANKIYDIEPGDSELTSGVTEIEASTILNASIDLYMANDGEERFELTYVEGVKEVTEEDEISLPVTGNTVVDSAEASLYEEGEIFVISPTSEYPNGAALKIVSKKLNSDGTYTVVTAMPEIWEVFDKIDVNQLVSADPTSFVPAEGVTVISTTGSTGIFDNIDYTHGDSIITNNNVDTSISPLKSSSSSSSKTLTLAIEISDGGLKVNSSLESSMDGVKKKLELTPMAFHDNNFERFNYLVGKTNVLPTDKYFLTSADKIGKYLSGKDSVDELKENLEDLKKEYKSYDNSVDPTKNWKAGCSITGSMELEVGVDVETKIDFGWFSAEVEKFKIDIYDNAKLNVEVKGTFEKKKILGEYSIPIGAGFCIGLKAILFAEINGTIKYTYEVSSTTSVSYDDGKYKKTHTESDSHNFEFGLEVEVGIKASLSIDILCFSLAECGVSVSGKVKVESSVKKDMSYEIDVDKKEVTYTDQLILSSKSYLYAPLIKIWVGGDDTLLGYVGVNVEFELLSEDNAPKIKFWDESVPIILEEETLKIPDSFFEEETTTEQSTTENSTVDTTVSANNEITISNFAITMEIGESQTIEPYVPDGYLLSDLVWLSSNNEVADVSNGKVTAKQSGNTTVTVTTNDGKYKGQCIILVN